MLIYRLHRAFESSLSPSVQCCRLTHHANAPGTESQQGLSPIESILNFNVSIDRAEPSRPPSRLPASEPHSPPPLGDSDASMHTSTFQPASQLLTSLTEPEFAVTIEAHDMLFAEVKCVCVYVCVCHTSTCSEGKSNIPIVDATLAFAVTRGFVLSLPFPDSFLSRVPVSHRKSSSGLANEPKCQRILSRTTGQGQAHGLATKPSGEYASI